MVGGAKAGDLIRAALVAMALCAGLQAAEPTMSLAEAAARVGPDFTPVNDGRTVMVTGQVSARPVAIAGFLHLPIQEHRHGLILETTGHFFDKLLPGDWVEAHGRITERWGLVVVSVTKVSLVSSGAPPVAAQVDARSAQRIDRIGQLVVTEGPVIELGSNFGGAYLRLGPSPESLKVFLPSSPGVRRGFVGISLGRYSSRHGHCVSVLSESAVLRSVRAVGRREQGRCAHSSRLVAANAHGLARVGNSRGVGIVLVAAGDDIQPPTRDASDHLCSWEKRF